MVESPTKGKSRGWQGAVLKLFGADDYELTVTGTKQITDHYVRVDFTGGGLLEERPVHPTMWIRMWFMNKHDKIHQRGYTLVDPNPATDTFSIEFAIHDGAAPRWALAAQPGDKINATFMGSKFALPQPAPAGWLIAGDPAALPAINSLLAALTESTPDVPATVWFEISHDDDRELPIAVRDHDTLHLIDRGVDGSAIVDEVRSAAFDASDHFGWVALDMQATRAIAALFKTDYKLDKKSVKAQAYWRAGVEPS